MEALGRGWEQLEVSGPIWKQSYSKDRLGRLARSFSSYKAWMIDFFHTLEAKNILHCVYLGPRQSITLTRQATGGGSQNAGKMTSGQLC